MTTPPNITLDGWLGARALRSAHRPALTFRDETWTYAEFAERVERLAGVLRDGGVVRGDRVGYLGLNHSAFLVALFASSRLGAIFVPLNFRLAGPEIEFAVNDAGLHTLIVAASHEALVESIRPKLVCVRYLPVEPLPQGERVAASASEPGDVAVIMYTSGTTGRPKGAMLTHSNIWWNNVNALLTMDSAEDDVSLNSAPLFHIGGLNVTTLISLMKGSHMVLHEQFDPEAFFDDVVRYRVTKHFAVPAMLLFLSQHERFAAADLSSLRSIIVGGAPVPEPLLRTYIARGVTLHQGYGMTETAPMITFLTPEWSLAKLGSAGRTPLLSEIRLIDAEGNVVTEPRTRGEICTRGPNIMAGYWQLPDATRETIDADGWLHTGDIGEIDEDGFLYVCDRVKDMIISGGENVYPAEVESVLYRHPAVAEVAVIGAPDSKWGEAVVAVTVLKAGASLTLDGLRDFAKTELAGYKLPSALFVIEGLPRNPAGKVLKHELRERYARESATPEREAARPERETAGAGARE
jgi:fatty-acyl-CoA synthase